LFTVPSVLAFWHDRDQEVGRIAVMLTNRVERRVEWGETDAAGIVFYPNIYRWFDAASHDLLAAAGVDVQGLLMEGYAIPLVETGARFLRPILYADRIEVVSAIEDVRTRGFRLRHTIRRGDDVLCEGHEVRVWARIVPGGIQAVPIPEETRTRFTAPE
jgi:acyl-CoA thioester hydrolase